jgi:2-dehydropantoate 2-reductase
VDAQMAVVPEVGARHGIPCPGFTRLVALIHEVEDGRRALHDDNLLELLP